MRRWKRIFLKKKGYEIVAREDRKNTKGGWEGGILVNWGFFQAPFSCVIGHQSAGMYFPFSSVETNEKKTKINCRRFFYISGALAASFSYFSSPIS